MFKMQRHNYSMKVILLIVLVVIDFLSKKMVFNFIELNNFIPLTSFMDIIHIHNYGISFGLFAGSLPSWVIIMCGILIIILLLSWMIKINNNLERWGLLLIIAGAISNTGDRLLNNYVLDFIYFHYNQYYWPSFNFADIYISIGVLLIIIETYKIFITRLRKKND